MLRYMYNSRSRIRAMEAKLPFYLSRTTFATAPASQTSPESDFSRFTGLAFFVSIAAGTAYLGDWQTKRYYWKRDMIKERTRQLHKEPKDLPIYVTAQSDENEELEFRQLRAVGKFRSNSTFFLYPRSAPSEVSDNVARTKSGGYVYSLLDREGSSTPVIINRGWLPRSKLESAMANIKTLELDDSEVSVVGVLRHGEQSGQFTPKNDIDNRHFYYLDHEGLAKAMDSSCDQAKLPIILDAVQVEAMNNDGQRIKFDSDLVRNQIHNYITFYMTPEKHAGYAVTWYSFTLTAIAMGYLRFRKGKVQKVLRK